MAGRRRSRAGARGARRGRRADLSRTCRPVSASACTCGARCSTTSACSITAFGLGYGEENDLCVRAARAGWRNVLADNAFVVHTGGRSFAGQKSELGRAQHRAAARAPSALSRHGARLHRGRSAASAARRGADAARRRCSARTRRPARDPSSRRRHRDARPRADRRLARALAALSRDRRRRPLAGRGASRATAASSRSSSTARRRSRGAISSAASARRSASRSCTCTTSPACREGMLDALADASGPVRLHGARSQFRVPDDHVSSAPTACIAARRPNRPSARAASPRSRRSRDVDIGAWRARHHALAARAAFRIAPSQWTADTLRRYFPDCPATVIAHGSPDGLPARAPGVRTRGRAARTTTCRPWPCSARSVRTRARAGSSGSSSWRARAAPRVRFVLIGYMDVQHGPWQSDDAVLTVHGRYETADLPDLLAHYRVALVLYPSAGPETFSYTLTEAWAGGRPVLVPPIGALAERVRDSGAGWVMTEAEWRDESLMLDTAARAARTAVRELARRDRPARAHCRTRPSTQHGAGHVRAVRQPRSPCRRDGTWRALQPLEPARLRVRAWATCRGCRQPADVARPSRRPRLPRTRRTRGCQSPPHAGRAHALPPGAAPRSSPRCAHA